MFLLAMLRRKFIVSIEREVLIHYYVDSHLTWRKIHDQALEILRKIFKKCAGFGEIFDFKEILIDLMLFLYYVLIEKSPKKS